MVKAKLYRQKSHKAYIYTLRKREKGNIYIYINKKEESNEINKQIYQQ